MPDDRLQRLHDHLAATGELPVETTASRYLGEAEAVVADALAPDTPESVVRERVEQARELLAHVDDAGDQTAAEHVDDAGDQTAAEHVEAARALCAALLEDE